MTRRNGLDVGQVNPDWVVSTEWKFGRHTLTPGTELTVTGLGRVRFRQHVETSISAWIDVWTPYGLRSVPAARIRTVHRAS